MSGADKDVWVFIESKAGRAVPVGLELLGASRALAARFGGKLTALVIGGPKGENSPGLQGIAQDAARHGADQVLLLEDKAFAAYGTGSYTRALAELAQKYKPEAFLFGATALGRDLAPRLACRLNTGLTADCVGLQFSGDEGELEWVCPAFGGRMMVAITCPERRPQIGTIRPGVFERPAPVAGDGCEIIREKVSTPDTSPDTGPDACLDTILLESIPKNADSGRPLEECEIIVGVGRGIGGAEGLKAAKKLAAALGARLGCTRAAIESGLLDEDCQIGQSGKMVRPRLYFALGISGCSQHMVGLRGNATVVAVNKDPKAAIFETADYGLVGDLKEVLPLLTKALEKRFAS